MTMVMVMPTQLTVMSSVLLGSRKSRTTSRLIRTGYTKRGVNAISAAVAYNYTRCVLPFASSLVPVVLLSMMEYVQSHCGVVRED